MEGATGAVRFLEEHEAHMIDHLCCSADRRLLAFSRARPGTKERHPGPAEVFARRWPLEQSANSQVPGDWGFIDALALSPD